MINKRGAIIHWILFGVLAAFAVFFLASRVSQAGLPLKGAWSIDAVRDLYLPAEFRLLKIDAAAKNVGSELAVELAQHGGYAAVVDSPCGQIRDMNSWNDGGKWCLPEVEITLAERAAEALSSRLDEKSFTNIHSNGKYLVGSGGTERVSVPLGTYSFNTGFAVDLGYAFEEYGQLQAEARQMVELCRDERDLAACLSARKPVHWKYGHCDQQEVTLPLETRRIPFCVESPGNYRVAISTDLSPLFWGVQYAVGLDLTPLQPLPQEEMTVKFNQQLNGFELKFGRDLSADKYMLYFGNDVSLILGSGPASEVFQPSKRSSETWWDAVSFKATDIVLGTTECVSEGVREPNKAYLCGSEILYTLADNRLTKRSKFVFAVTTHIKDKESQIRKVVLGSKE